MDLSILGIPMDLGAGRRGVDMGPSALRNAHLAGTLRGLGHTVTDLGDVEVPLPETVDKHAEGGLIFLDPIIAACRSAAERVAALPEGTFPVTLGGDHSVSMGTVTGNALRGAAPRRTGLIWVDAHTDYNTPHSSPSGNIHGMPVAHLTGLGDPPYAQDIPALTRRLLASGVVAPGGLLVCQHPVQVRLGDAPGWEREERVYGSNVLTLYLRDGESRAEPDKIGTT